MARADLRTSIRNTIAGRQTCNTPQQSISPAEAPPLELAAGPVADPIVSAVRPRRTVRSRLLGRLADYARRYLTDGIQQRLNLIQADQSELRTLAALQTQALDHAIVVHADHTRRMVSEQLASFGVALSQLQAHLAELEERSSAMELKLATEMNAKLASLAAQIELNGTKLSDVAVQLTAAETTLGDVATAALVERELQRESRTLFQARLDEVIATTLADRELQRESRTLFQARLDEVIATALADREIQRETRTLFQARLDEVIATTLADRELQRETRALLQARLDEVITATLADREFNRETRTLFQTRLDEVIAAALVNREIQTESRSILQASSEASRVREEGIQVELSVVDDRLKGVNEQLAASVGHIGAMRDETAITRSEVAALPALFGPRLDEIEIKVRPLIEYDAESIAVRTRDGYLMVSRAEPMLALMIANATSGGLEPGVRRVLTALAQPGMRAADVGANVGLLTLALAYAVGPQGRVWSFEPQADVMHQLRKTLHLNGLRWVEAVEKAAGARAETLTFNVSPIIGHSSLYDLPTEDGLARQVKVPVVPLDEFIPAGEHLDVVKIDVEGAELDVLAGMSRLVKRNRDIAIVAEFGPSHLARVGISVDAWFDAFAAHGLTPYAISEPDGSCHPVDRQTVAEVQSLNIVFVRAGGPAETRLPR